MATLSDIISDPIYKNADSSNKKRYLDNFFKDPEAETSDLHETEPFFLKQRVDLDESFRNETPLRQNFLQKQNKSLQELRKEIQSFEGGTGEDTKAFREQAVGRHATRVTNINSEFQGRVHVEENISFHAQEVLNNDFTRQEAREKRLDETRDDSIFDDFKRSSSETLDDTLAVASGIVVDGDAGSVFRNQLEIARSARDQISKRLLDRGDKSPDEVNSEVSDIIDFEDQFRDNPEGIKLNRLGEVTADGKALASQSISEIEKVVDGLGVTPAAKKRFMAQAPAMKKEASEQVAQVLRDAIESNDLDVLPNGERRALFRNFTNEQKEFQEDLLSTPEGVEQAMRTLKEENSGFFGFDGVATQKLSASLRSLSGGLVSSLAGAFGKDEFAKRMADGVQFLEERDAKINEFRQASDLTNFSGDLTAILPDLLLARGGAGAGSGAATGVSRIARLFGITGKAAPKILTNGKKAATLFGAAAGSGLGSGTRTYNEALAKGFDPDEALTLGLQSFLITAGVAAAGGNRSGIEGLVTGELRVGFRNSLKEYFGTILKGAANEGIEELTDSVLSALTTQQKLNPDATTHQHVEGALHAFALGAAMGGGGPAITSLPNLKSKPTSQLTDGQLLRVADDALGDLGEETRGSAVRKAVEGVELRKEAGGADGPDPTAVDRTTDTEPVNSEQSSEETTEVEGVTDPEEVTETETNNISGEGIEAGLKEAAAEWDRANRNIRSDEWFEGGNANEASLTGFGDALRVMGQRGDGELLAAHGMSKSSTLSGGLESLISIFTDGIDPNRGGGKLDTAPLTGSEGNGGATASGNAYNDGPFVLVAKPGVNVIRSSDDIGGVLVNEAHSEITDSLRTQIQRVAPNVSVESYSKAGKLAGDVYDNSKTQEETPSEVDQDTFQKAESIAKRSVKGDKIELIDAARDAVVDQLIKDPSTSDRGLSTIARNAVVDQTRVKGGRVKAEGRITTDENVLNNQSDDTADSKVENREKLDQVSKVIEALPAKQREAIESVTNGESIKDIAARRGVTETTVRGDISRARKALKTQFESEKESSFEPLPPEEQAPPGRSNEEALAEVVANLQRDTGPDAVEAREAASRVTLTAKPSESHLAAVATGRKFGRQVVVVDGLEQNGLFFTDNPDIILLSSKTDKPELSVFFHELLHSFRATNEEAYQEFAEAVDVRLGEYIEENNERETGTFDGNKEEFLADFLADRAVDPAFWQNLSENVPSAVQKIAQFLRDLLKFLKINNQGTAKFLNDVEAANEAAESFLIDSIVGGEMDSESSSVRFSRKKKGKSDKPRKTFKQGKAGKNPQVQGTFDPNRDKETRKFVAVEKAVKDVFDWRNLPLDEDGSRQALEFLANLTDVDFIERLQQRVVDAGFQGNASLATTGVARASYFAAASRFIESDVDTARSLIDSGYRLAQDIKFLLEFDKHGDSASELGLALRSLRSFEGGSILTLFELEAKGRKKVAEDALGSDAAEAADGIDKKSQNTETEKDEVSEKATGEMQNPEQAEKLRKAERRIDVALRQIEKLLAPLFGNSKAKFQRKAQDAFEDFQKQNKNNDDLFARLDTMEEVISLLGSGGIPKPVRKKLNKARKQTTADALAARVNRKANNLGSPKRPKVKTELEKRFDELLEKDLDEDAFIKEATDLGVTPETAQQLFESHTKINDFKKAEDARKEAKKEADKAEQEAKKAKDKLQRIKEKGDKLVDELGQKAEKKEGPKKQTLKKLFDQFIDPKVDEKSVEALTKELTALTTADGNTPLLTKKQVVAAVAKSIAARKAAVEAADLAANLKADKTSKDKAKRLNEAAAKKAKKAKDSLDKTIDEIDNSPAKKSGKKLPTLKQLYNEFTNPKKPERTVSELETDLANLKDRDGKPLLTPNQISNLATKAVARRQAEKRRAAAKAKVEETRKSLKKLKSEVSKAEKILNPVKPRKKSEKRSIAQIIREDVINNPLRRVSTEAERIELAEQIIRERFDLPEAQVKSVARNIEAQLGNKLFEAKMKAAEPIFKALGAGKNLTKEQIEKAIRLQILDPKYTFATSVSALLGWNGLTTKETTRLVELQRNIDRLGLASFSSHAFLFEQARIISAAVGVPPTTAEFWNAWFRGSVYSAMSSQGIGFVAVFFALSGQLVSETAIALVARRSPSEVLDIWGKFFKLIVPALRQIRATFKKGAAYTDQLQGGQEKALGDQVFLDALTERYDIARRRLRLMKGKKGAKITRDQAKEIIASMTSIQFLTLRALSAVDSGATRFYSQFQASILANREAKSIGITKEDMDGYVQAARADAEAVSAHMRDNLGITDPDLIALEVHDRIEGGIMNELIGRGVSSTLLEESIANVQAQIGTGKTDGTYIGISTNAISDGVVAAQRAGVPLAWALPAVRTVGVIMEYLSWWTPGLSIAKWANYKRLSPERRAEVYKSITSDWIFQKRQAAVLFSNGAVFALSAAFKANDELEDEDKWLWMTLSYPSGDADEIKRWNANHNQWDEYTLSIGDQRFRLDKGFAQVLLPSAVMAMAFNRLTKASSEDRFGEELLYIQKGLFELYIPGVSQIKGDGKDLERKGLGGTLLSRADQFVPFSGLLKSVKRAQPKVDKKASDAAWWYNNPFYVVPGAEGVVLMQNVLGEELEWTAGDALKGLGLPVYWKVKRESRDPLKAEAIEEFERRKYFGGSFNIPAFKKKLEDNGREYSADILEVAKQTRIKETLRLFRENRKELDSMDDKHFGDTMSGYWRKGVYKYNEQLGLKTPAQLRKESEE